MHLRLLRGPVLHFSQLITRVSNSRTYKKHKGDEGYDEVGARVLQSVLHCIIIPQTAAVTSNWNSTSIN